MGVTIPSWAFIDSHVWPKQEVLWIYQPSYKIIGSFRDYDGAMMDVVFEVMSFEGYMFVMRMMLIGGS